MAYSNNLQFIDANSVIQIQGYEHFSWEQRLFKGTLSR